MAWQKIDIEIPDDLKPAQRKELGDLIIERIYDRTVSGVDKNGKRFPGYSKTYMDSLDFKVSGKGRNVDLQLSGDMLAAIELLKDSKGSIRIGFEKGSEENAKAEGNITGSYGKSSGDPKKARDFLGISDRDLARLIKKVR